MRKTSLFVIIGSLVFALASCQKDSDNVGPDNSIVNESVQATALTATVTTVFSKLDLEDRNYGTFGVFYTKSNNAETMFERWKNGEVSVESIGMKKASSIKADGHMTVTIEGLEPETEYKYCSFFESEDKTRRKIGEISDFKTKEFKITLKNDGAVEINFYSGKVAATLSDIEDADCKGITFGILVSSKDNPTVSDGKVLELSSGVTKKQYTFKFEKLNLSTTYYCRPYVLLKSDNKYVYGETRTFKTRDADEMAIDMGTSVLWSKFLLGSEEVGEPGDYYRWGETSPVTNNSYVLPDVDNISGDPQYDAATKKLGGKWRMPTADEINELINVCGDNWSILEGPDCETYGLTNKMIIKSNKNSDRIVIPQTGYYYATSWGGINGTLTLSYSRPYGYFYIYSGSQTTTTYTTTGYWVIEEKMDEFNAYSATHDVMYVRDLLELGLIEERTETVTDKGATVMEPGLDLDVWYSYKSAATETQNRYNYKPVTEIWSGSYAFNILPVRDKD